MERESEVWGKEVSFTTTITITKQFNTMQLNHHTHEAFIIQLYQSSSKKKTLKKPTVLGKRAEVSKGKREVVGV